MESIISEVKKMSIFGRDLQFEKDYNNRFVSIYSFVLTLLVIIATIITGFIFGNEIYERKTPKFTTSKNPVSSLETKFFIKDIPMLLNFRTPSGLPISDETIKKALIFRIVIVTITEGVVTQVVKEIKKCNITDYTDENKKKLLEIEFKVPGLQYYCISPEEFLQSKYGGTNSQSIIIYVAKCANNCMPNLDTFIEGINVSFSYLNSYIEPSDYSNPIKFYFEKTPLRLYKNLSKEVTLSFTKNSIVTNKGWIFPDSNTQHYVTYDSDARNVFFSDRNLLNIAFDSPSMVLYSTREYMRVQDLLANVGGFFNALYIIVAFIFTNFIKFEYYVYIHEKFVKFEEANKSDKINESQGKILINNFVSNNLRNNNESNNRKNEHENISSEGSQKNLSEESIEEGKFLFIRKLY